MTPELYVTLAVAVIGLAGSIVATTRKTGRGRRDYIEQDQRILKELAPSSDAAKALRANIEARVQETVKTSAGTRDPSGIVLAILLLAGAVAMGSWAFARGDGWSLPIGLGAGLLAVIGAVGLTQ
ncbi:MAG: hypothetical protein HGA44_21315, partial [Cellulomonadaceae bacterium]|nr:hypothetical protein [Cellulomonadaceae bacterium]